MVCLPNFLQNLIHLAKPFQCLKTLSPQHCFVNINFKVESNHLVFECENSLPNVKQINHVGGLGLQNVKRRLELIYNNDYSLVMNNIDNKYLVKLKLPL